MREISLEEFVDEVYEDYKENPDTEYIFFLGAGCSKSSGIKLASELAREWYEKLKKQKSKFNRFNKLNKIKNIDKDVQNFGNLYFQIFETLFPTPLAQQKEIQRITENSIPSLGYYVLSELMQLPPFNMAITTNFDNLIQDALIYSGNKRALVITHQDLAKFIKRDHTPLITKIHGDAHLHPFNNSKDTKDIPEDLRIAIQGLFINTKVIFIGYKGNDVSIAKLLEGCKRIDQVYWLSSSHPKDIVLEEWWNKQSIKTFIEERDFDKIMSLIKSKFNLSKPNFDKIVKKLETSYEKAIEEEIEDLESIREENKTFIDYVILANTYYAQHEYDKAIETYKKSLEFEPNNSAIYNSIGASYHMNKEYKEAIKSYKKSIEFDPNNESAYNNLAIVHHIEGDMNKSIESSMKAIEINSEFADAYDVLGRAYAAKEMYEIAFENYNKALKLNPDLKHSYTNLFELQLIIHNKIDSQIEEEFINRFSTSMEFEMLKILENIVNDKVVDVFSWLDKYKYDKFDWNFSELDNWIKNMQNKNMKEKLLEVVEIFKSKST